MMWSFDVPNTRFAEFLEKSAEGRAIQRRLGATNTRVWNVATGKDVGRIIVASEFESWAELGAFNDRQSADGEWQVYIEKAMADWSGIGYWTGIMDEIADERDCAAKPSGARA
jgi:hypothetical protein